jgi:hypothetical protein
MIGVKKSLDEQKHFTQRAKQHLFPLTPFRDSETISEIPTLPAGNVDNSCACPRGAAMV